jgi:hypothetical protein
MYNQKQEMMETRLIKGFSGYPEKTEVEALQSSDKILNLKERKVNPFAEK